jgi:glutaconyl-CoA decarboxylase
LAVAAGRFLGESGVAGAGAALIRRSGRWTVAGRLDAVGMGGFDRVRVEARKRPMQTFQVTIAGQVYEVTVEAAGRAAPPPRAGRPPKPVKPGAARAGESPGGERAVRAPMPGKILTVNVGAADPVGMGTVLVVLEAMKMENDVLAPVEGTVKTVCVRPGETVNTGDVMVVIE